MNIHRTPHTAYRQLKLTATLLFSFSLLLLFSSCGNKKGSELSVSDIKNPLTADGMDEQQKASLPDFQFEALSYDFGKVIQGEVLSYTFHFKNVGKSSLLISSIEASCGCTTSIPPKAPIRPGEKGEISISFDSRHKNGEVISYLVVTANTYPAQTVLTVNANVVNP
jgi:hypothetical protein